MNRTDVAKWLEGQFLEWQAKQGESKTVTEFAEFLGVSRNTLNNWLNRGQNPEGENIDLIASRLGPGIYDALGLPRPDPELQAIINQWPRISDGGRRRLSEAAAVYSVEGKEVRVPKITNVDLKRLVKEGKISPMLAAILANWEFAPQDVKDEILRLLEKAKKRKTGSDRVRE